jgi:NarL family two-component system sensor histidine kinase YdfH
MERARSTLADARRAIDDLNAGPGSPQELEKVIRSEAERIEASTASSCRLSFDLPAVLPGILMRVCQRFVIEAMSNAACHAQAQTIDVRVNVVGPDLVAEVQDDGRGFDPQVEIGRPGHYGLSAAGEQAKRMGGTLNIDSAPGAGARLSLTLPITERVSQDLVDQAPV